MADQQPSDVGDNTSESAEIWSSIAERSTRILAEYLSRQSGDGVKNPDPLNISAPFMEMFSKMMENPQQILAMQADYMKQWADLWFNSSQALMGKPAEPLIEPEAGDRRFRDQAWSENAVFDYIKQSYLLAAQQIQSSVGAVDGLDDDTRHRVDFYTNQFVDAMSPTNFAATNPKVIEATVETKGENLVNGMQNMLDDLERGKGKLAIRMTDQDAFEVGENIAVSKGQVVYQNDLMQLLQFNPSTKQVFEKPLLIIPPWINKYYILDLRPENSFIKWATGKGHTVFVISWVNPDTKLAEKTFTDYMHEGPLDAINAIEKATGEKQVNVIGYCLGGTLLATTLAWMTSKRKANRVASATFFTSLVDFTDAGDLKVFIDDAQIEMIEERMDQAGGVLDGADMASTFNMLRANDLIWSFVINNYLLGKEPMPFDLLYWNSDSTRMPKAMHTYYLRNMYQKNLLREPGGIEVDGVKIDLRKVKVPVCIVSTKDDHIAPADATYAATQLYSGPVKFILAGSGHIAGIVNPEGSEKYGYWVTGNRAKNPPTPQEWLEKAKQKPGSWWPEWQKWIAPNSGEKVPARKPGDGKLKPIEPTPGSYVKVKSTEPEKE
jgi:polyhydroxyalkanoate synthase